MINEYDTKASKLSLVEENTKHKYGQYFTPKMVAEFMVNLADIVPKSKILEPSCGEGIFLEVLQNKGFHQLTAYEIDTKVLFLLKLKKNMI